MLQNPELGDDVTKEKETLTNLVLEPGELVNDIEVDLAIPFWYLFPTGEGGLIPKGDEAAFIRLLLHWGRLALHLMEFQPDVAASG